MLACARAARAVVAHGQLAIGAALPAAARRATTMSKGHAQSLSRTTRGVEMRSAPVLALLRASRDAADEDGAASEPASSGQAWVWNARIGRFFTPERSAAIPDRLRACRRKARKKKLKRRRRLSRKRARMATRPLGRRGPRD